MSQFCGKFTGSITESSFLLYKVDRKSSLFHSTPFSKLLHLFLHMYYALLSLLFCFLLPLLSNSIPPCNFHTTYYITAPYSRSLVFYSLAYSSPYNHILYTLRMSPLLWILSTLLYTLLLLLGAAPLLYYAPLPSSTLFIVVPLLSSLDTPTSCVPLPHI